MLSMHKGFGLKIDTELNNFKSFNLKWLRNVQLGINVQNEPVVIGVRRGVSKRIEDATVAGGRPLKRPKTAHRAYKGCAWPG
jgi:hypothetical protein